MNHQTGAHIQSAILQYCKKHCKGTVVAYNIEVASERGVPDLLCCVNGRFVGIKVKGYGDIVKPIQVAQAARIIEAGGEAFVVKSLDEFKEVLKGL